MLSEVEQAEILRQALRLATTKLEHKRKVASHVMSQKRADALWKERVYQLRDYLRRTGRLPVPGVQNATQQVDAAQKAHESNGTQNV